MVKTFKREYPLQPIIAVAGIIFDNQSVLLVKRANAPGKGQWSLPGGAVELGETVNHALIREVREEVSIDIEIGGLVRLFDRIEYDKVKKVRFHYVIADYWGNLLSGDARAGSDISEARFVDFDRVKKMGVGKDVMDTIYMSLRMKDKT